MADRVQSPSRDGHEASQSSHAIRRNSLSSGLYKDWESVYRGRHGRDIQVDGKVSRSRAHRVLVLGLVIVSGTSLRLTFFRFTKDLMDFC